MIGAPRDMRLKKFIILLVLVAAGIGYAGCKSGEGPLLINTSGRSIRLVVHLTDGTSYDGECADQSAVWAGQVKSAVSRIEILMGETTYELDGEELTVPYGKDPTTAFIVEAGGLRKLALDEAKILMRGR